MSARNICNLTVNQKTSYEVTFNLKNDETFLPINLTNYTVSSKIKENYTDPDYSEIDFGATISNTSSGEITLSLNANQTSSMIRNKYVYDVVITDDSNFSTRVIEGTITTSRGVT